MHTVRGVPTHLHTPPYRRRGLHRYHLPVTMPQLVDAEMPSDMLFPLLSTTSRSPSQQNEHERSPTAEALRAHLVNVMDPFLSNPFHASYLLDTSAAHALNVLRSPPSLCAAVTCAHAESGLSHAADTSFDFSYASEHLLMPHIALCEIFLGVMISKRATLSSAFTRSAGTPFPMSELLNGRFLGKKVLNPTTSHTSSSPKYSDKLSIFLCSLLLLHLYARSELNLTHLPIYLPQPTNSSIIWPRLYSDLADHARALDFPPPNCLRHPLNNCLKRRFSRHLDGNTFLPLPPKPSRPSPLFPYRLPRISPGSLSRHRLLWRCVLRPSP